MKAINWNAFAKKVKLVTLKYTWDYIEEANK